MKRFPLWVIPMIIIGCLADRSESDKAELTCYSGGAKVYYVLTETYKIHKPAVGIIGDKWEVDTDDGKITLTADCIYKPLKL